MLFGYSQRALALPLSDRHYTNQDIKRRKIKKQTTEANKNRRQCEIKEVPDWAQTRKRKGIGAIISISTEKVICYLWPQAVCSVQAAITRAWHSTWDSVNQFCYPRSRFDIEHAQYLLCTLGLCPSASEKPNSFLL